MSELLALFPLPNMVLFPNVFLPLHVFEPRYREMVADAMAADRMIGMALLRPGWEHDYERRPPVFPIGCMGVITHLERLTDGRYNLVLRGVQRFRIVQEDLARDYRRAVVEPLAEPLIGDKERAILRRYREKLQALLASGMDPKGSELKMASAMPDEDLVNALAQYFDFEPLEKQALLEQDSLCRRAEALVELLEMKVLIARHPGSSHTTH